MTPTTAVFLFLTLLVLALTALFVATHPARSQDGHTEGHGRFHTAYSEWHQPGIFPPISCCNEKVIYRNGDGAPVGHTGDCYPTEFRVNPLAKVPGHGYWIVRLDDEDAAWAGSQWMEVPDEKIIHEKNPDDSGVTGHLCISSGKVLCAVAPTGGG